MSKDIVVFSCAHADPLHSNERFNWLGEYIHETKPNMVIDLGDGADMRSLNAYDRPYPRAVVSQQYEKDIESYLDSQERLRHKVKKAKKKRPMWVGFEGNHEHRIKKAIELDPRQEGQTYGISFSHLQTNKWFDEYHEYEHSGPAIASYCGVDFAHYFCSNNSGSATSGLHHAHTLINNRHNSSVCGHSHFRNIYFKDGASSIGLVVGCYKGGPEGWAGQSNDAWWKGIVHLKNVEDGMFEPQFISMEMLKEEYSG